MSLWYVPAKSRLPRVGCLQSLVTGLTVTFLGLQQKQAEQEEEFIVNKLMKRLDQLKQEKQVLANEVCTEDGVGYDQICWLSFNVASDMFLICRSNKKKST